MTRLARFGSRSTALCLLALSAALGCETIETLPIDAQAPIDRSGFTPIRPVEMPALEFDAGDRRIPGRMGLCLNARLRGRQWNVRPHPFRIDLGSRAGRSIEQMAKGAFESVEVAFEEDCAARRPGPWLDVQIESARRGDRDEIVVGELQSTSLVLSATIREGSDEPIWRRMLHSTSRVAPAGLPRRSKRSEREKDPWFLRLPEADPERANAPDERVRHEHAARQFGLVLADALSRLFEELLESEEVRQAAGAAVLSRTDAPAP